jgi:hypothetical protein
MGYKRYTRNGYADGTYEDIFMGEEPFWPLDPNEVAIVLLVCKGVITLDEAHNILPYLSVEHLINEAQAWAVAEAEAN